MEYLFSLVGNHSLFIEQGCLKTAPGEDRLHLQGRTDTYLPGGKPWVNTSRQCCWQSNCISMACFSSIPLAQQASACDDLCLIICEHLSLGLGGRKAIMRACFWTLHNSPPPASWTVSGSREWWPSQGWGLICSKPIFSHLSVCVHLVDVCCLRFLV